jgi:hypothetical protein
VLMKSGFSKHRKWKAARLMGCFPSCRQTTLRYAFACYSPR